MKIFQYCLSLILFLVSIILSQAVPAPLDRNPVRFSGTIEGSPVIAIFHGPSAPLKDDVQDKDTQDDPLASFGSPME